MSVSAHIASLTRSAAGQMTAKVVIQPAEFTSFYVEIVFDDRGNEENNLHHIQAVLQSFSQAFSVALQRPLKIVRKLAVKG
jgi:hypothetical protein